MMQSPSTAVRLLSLLLAIAATRAFVTVSPQTSRQQQSALAASAPPLLSELSDPSSNPLIQLAHEYVYEKSGFYSPYDANVFSDDFVFRGPYIGPLNKKDYFSTMDTFKIYEALPDINPNAFGYHVDPQNPKRIWFMCRNTGTFTNPLNLGLTSIPPNGKSVEGCPETFSITFDEENKIKHLTVGYVADRFQGNTRGKGAAVGIFKAVGLPFPAPGPLLQFAQWFGTEIANGGAYSYSSPEDVREWWTSQDKASEGYL